MDYAKKLKVRFRVGDPNLPERRTRYTSRREEEDGATNMYRRGVTIKSRTVDCMLEYDADMMTVEYCMGFQR